MSTEVLGEARRRIEAGWPVALATVVATRGSTPQKVGARLLVADGERLAGTLGGGAMEAEVMREAAGTLTTGPLLREYALSSATDDWGLACGGTMVVFLEPLGPSALGWLGVVAKAAAGGSAFALLTPVEGERAGRRRWVTADGEGGDPGNPALALQAAALGRSALERETAEVETLGGERVFVEAFMPPPTLVILGAGHVGKALCALGRFLGVPVTVIDDRPEYASRTRFPEADRVVAAPVPEGLARQAVHPGTAIVVAMRNQDLDYEATAAALATPARYVGLIGARRKAVLIVERLLAGGMPVERVRALRSPIGLDIGARAPEEIAVAIVGEWVMLRQGGSGAPLRLDEELFRKATARGG